MFSGNLCPANIRMNENYGKGAIYHLWDKKVCLVGFNMQTIGYQFYQLKSVFLTLHDFFKLDLVEQ